MVNVRLATRGDESAVLKLADHTSSDFCRGDSEYVRNLFGEFLSDTINFDTGVGSYFYVATYDNIIGGVLSFELTSDCRMKNNMLIVFKSSRLLGVSLCLLNMVDDFMERYSIPEISCLVSKKNESGVAYLLHNGYVRAGSVCSHSTAGCGDVIFHRLVKHFDHNQSLEV